MTQASGQEQPARDSFEWDFAWDEETLQRGGIDAVSGAELARQVSISAAKLHADELDRARQAALQVLAVWSPYLTPILKQLRKQGVDLDALLALIGQSDLEQDSRHYTERLTEELSRQRTAILEAISEVTDLRRLERRVRAIESPGRQGCFTFDSVLAITGHEDE